MARQQFAKLQRSKPPFAGSSPALSARKTCESRIRSAKADLRRDTVRQQVREGDFCQNMYYVYSLKCGNGYYIGCTDNLKDKMERHQKGQVRLQPIDCL